MGGVILANFLKLYLSNRRKKKNNLWFRNSNLKKTMNQIKKNKNKISKMDCSVSFIKKIIVQLSAPKNAECVKTIPKSVSNVNKNTK